MDVGVRTPESDKDSRAPALQPRMALEVLVQGQEQTLGSHGMRVPSMLQNLGPSIPRICSRGPLCTSLTQGQEGGVLGWKPWSEDRGLPG